eukprot:Selendium_serpulae@DN6386_c2_g1_i5.p1
MTDPAPSDSSVVVVDAAREEGDKQDQISSEVLELERSDSFVPYVAHSEYPEITIRGGILTAILAVTLGAANVYLGLLVGLTVSASIPASVISMACLKLFKDSNILENNIVQTGASAGEALAAGVIFTLPGLVIIHNYESDPVFSGAEGWETFMGVNYAYTLFIAILGGFMGIMLSIPIRKALVIDIRPPLSFPEGVATAGVLKAGEASGWNALAVVTGAGLGALTKLMEAMGLWDPVMVWGWLYTSSSNSNVKYPSQFGWNVTGALFGVGYIVGWKTTIVLFAGSVLHHIVIVPVHSAINDGFLKSNYPPADFTGTNLADEAFNETKFMGVGMMMVGAVWTLIAIRKPLYHSMILAGRELYHGVKRTGQKVELKRYEKDFPVMFSMTWVIVCIVGLYIVYCIYNGRWGWNVLLSIFALLCAFLFSAVAAFMAGLVGSSNNPISGVTICSTIVMSGLVLAMFGSGDLKGPSTVIMFAGGIACCCAISGDNMQDLKAGHILGATPWKQEAIMMLGVFVAAIVVAPILELLDNAYVMGSNELPAPQAWLIATIPAGIINGTLAWREIGVGMIIGCCVIALDMILVFFKVPFRTPVLAFAVANYLPVYYIVPMFFGGMINLAFAPHGSAEDLASEGTLYAAGLIAGDALTGIAVAVPIVITGNGDCMKVVKDPRMWAATFPLLWLLGTLAFFAKWQPFTRIGNMKLAEKKEREGAALEGEEAKEILEGDGSGVELAGREESRYSEPVHVS